MWGKYHQSCFRDWSRIGSLIFFVHVSLVSLEPLEQDYQTQLKFGWVHHKGYFNYILAHEYYMGLFVRDGEEQQ